MKVLLRIIVSPFVWCIQFIWLNYVCLKTIFLFIRYGGEWITYDTEHTKPTIKKIFDELKNKE